MQDFESTQPIAYKILNNSLKSGKISNAYLIEDNNTKQGYKLACSFCECLINAKVEQSANVIVVKPEGQWIRKEQIDEIKTKFATKAIIGEYKVYIIENAEKLNQSSGNTLLKFLEEPESNIIAILVTENINQVLETIKSRCLIVPLFSNKNDEENIVKVLNSIINGTLELEITKEKVEEAIKFLEYVEKNKVRTLLHLKKMLNQFEFNKNDVEILFNIMLLFYKEVLEYKTLQKSKIFNEYLSTIKVVSGSNEIDKLIKKSQLIIEILDDLKYNANIQMIFDKFLIRMEEI